MVNETINKKKLSVELLELAADDWSEVQMQTFFVQIYAWHICRGVELKNICHLYSGLYAKYFNL